MDELEILAAKLNKLSVDPRNQDLVLGFFGGATSPTSGGGAFRSTDGGQTWARTSSVSWGDAPDVVRRAHSGFPFSVCGTKPATLRDDCATCTFDEHPAVRRAASASPTFEDGSCLDRPAPLDDVRCITFKKRERSWYQFRP